VDAPKNIFANESGGGGIPPVVPPVPGSIPPGDNPPPNTPVNNGDPPATPPLANIKVGEVEVPVAEAVTRLQWMNQNADVIKNLTPLLEALSKKDHDGALSAFKSLAGEPPPKTNPDDVKGRLDKLEGDRILQAQIEEADNAIKAISDKLGADFKADESLKLLNDAGYGYDPATFEVQLAMAHKAIQYDALKTNFDAKVKEEVAKELETEKRRGDSAKSKSNGDHVAAPGEKDYSGEIPVVVKRNRINIFPGE